MTISFVDLSHHQVSVDLAAYARAGHDRVVLKATEGTGYVDPTFTARWRAAAAAGLARVAYHYARAVNNGAAEFDRLLAAVNAAGGLGPRDWLCLDAEDTATPARASGNAAEFCARAVARGYPNGIVYTGRWYADPNRLTAAVFPPGWRRLWISDYTPGQPDNQVELPAGWTRAQVVARQYTDRATVAGVGSPCDDSRLINDWLTGQPPTEVDMPLTDAEFLRIRQEVIAALNDPTHQYLQDELAPLKQAAAQNAAALSAVAALVGQPGGLTAEQARQIALDAAKEAVDGITITVHEGATP